MNNMNKLGWLFLILFFVSIALIIKIGTTQEYTLEIVDCYDEFSHKIIGLNCEKRVGENSWFGWLAFPIILFEILALLFFIRGSKRNKAALHKEEKEE